MSETKISVLLLEDDRGYATLVADNLGHRGFAVSIAHSVGQALEMSVIKSPDVLVADVYLGPGPSGLDVGNQLQKAFPKLKVVYLTNVKEPRLVEGAESFKMGSAAYLHKDRLVNPEFLSEVIRSRLMGGRRSEFRDDRDSESQLSGLTATQIEVLRLMAAGQGNAEIAELRGTSQRAVETIQSRIFAALNIQHPSRSVACTRAIKAYLAEAGLHRGMASG